MARNPKTKKKSRKAKNGVPILGDDAETSGAGAEQASGNASRQANGDASQQPTRVWQPGVDNLEDGEELQFDPTAYDCLHAFHLGWPCLSFDVARDGLGMMRNDFPHTMFIVAGTQADAGPRNVVIVAKLSNITGVRRGPMLATPMDADGEENDSEDDSSSDEEDNGTEAPTSSSSSSKTPVLQARMVAHQGCVNRIRVMPQQPHIVATWSDTGYVQVWDVAAHVRALSTGTSVGAQGAANNVLRQAPLHVFTGHKDEGFAIDWSPITPGRLVTGDCKSGVHLWEPTTSGNWTVDRAGFKGHTASVEDLQWSPAEADVFASCSVDGTLRIWDTRNRSQSAISVKAHDADVNVISWNSVASCMIASGCDDGTFRIWDLRSFKDSFIAHFNYHTAPITSIEWSPHEASTLAATCADNQLTVWDLSLERDKEEEAEYQAQIVRQQQAEMPSDLPPQLLFVHLGQKDIKEAHWHPQIQGLIVSTAGDGFNVLRPSNLENLPPASQT